MDLPSSTFGPALRGPSAGSSFGNILDDCAVPYLALDPSGVIMRMNEPAREVLRGVGAVRHPSVFVAVLAPRSISRFHRFLLRLHKTRKPSTTTVSLRTTAEGSSAYRVDGSWVSSGSRSGGYCLISMFDVSEQQRAQAELASTEVRVRVLLDLLPDPVVLLNRLEVQSANQAAVEFFGVGSDAELIGRDLRSFVTEAYLESVNRHTQLPRGARNETSEIRILDARGRQRVAEATWMRTPVEIRSDSPMMCVLRDVGDRRMLEAQLAHAERLRTLATLAAGVAHEVNNPLTYVLLALDEAQRLATMGDRLDSDEGRRELGEHLAEAVEGASRVREIVRGLSRFSRSDTESAAVDVNAALQRAVQLATAELRYRARILTSFGQIRHGLAPDGRLVQVLLNLIINAAQAIEEGDPEHNRVSVSTFECGDEVVIAVEDTGVGIPEPARAHIFEPFFTTKRAGEGTGLGLFVCHQYVQGWGGTIEVESDGRSWTRFTVTVPIVQDTARSVPTELPRTVAARGGRLLAVDDERVILQGISGALRDLVDEVELVDSATEALERIKSGESYDLILCDLQMPSMSGPDFYEALARIRPEMLPRLVFVTGGACTSKARTFLERQSPVVLTKPFTRAELRQFVSGRLRLERLTAE